MSDYELTIERAFDTNALSLFNCGVREIDQLIHKKTGGLSSFIKEVPCEFYIVKANEDPVALFVLSNRPAELQQVPQQPQVLLFDRKQLPSDDRSYLVMLSRRTRHAQKSDSFRHRRNWHSSS